MTRCATASLSRSCRAASDRTTPAIPASYVDLGPRNEMCRSARRGPGEWAIFAGKREGSGTSRGKRGHHLAEQDESHVSRKGYREERDSRRRWHVTSRSVA